MYAIIGTISAMLILLLPTLANQLDHRAKRMDVNTCSGMLVLNQICVIWKLQLNFCSNFFDKLIILVPFAGNFDIKHDIIIRSEDSIQMGAKFLTITELNSQAECAQLCCRTANCDVFVYQQKVNILLWFFCYFLKWFISIFFSAVWAHMLLVSMWTTAKFSLQIQQARELYECHILRPKQNYTSNSSTNQNKKFSFHHIVTEWIGPETLEGKFQKWIYIDNHNHHNDCTINREE